MSGTRMRFDITQAKSTAKSLKNRADKINKIYKDFSRSFDQLTWWKGSSKNGYDRRMQDALDTIKKAAEVIDELGNDLIIITDEQQQEEQRNVKRALGFPTDAYLPVGAASAVLGKGFREELIAKQNGFNLLSTCSVSYMSGWADAAATEVDAGKKSDKKGFWDKVLDGVQPVMDIVGLIPVVGEIADGVNAVIYTARGDYVNAALSAAAMIPFAGWAATVGKYGDEVIDGVSAVIKYLDEIVNGVEAGVKHSDEVIDGVEAGVKHSDEVIDGVESAAKHTDEVIDGVESAAKHTEEDGEQIAKHGDDDVVQGSGNSITIGVGNWLTLNGKASTSSDGRIVNIPSSADKTKWAMKEDLTKINKYAPEGLVVNIGSNGELTDENGRYWVAVGPMVMNPNHDKDKKITAEEMKYGTNIDVVVKDANGNVYYIYARVGDAKNHTYPEGIVQTGYAFPSGTDPYPNNADGSIIEFMGKASIKGFREYEIVNIIVYDK